VPIEDVAGTVKELIQAGKGFLTGKTWSPLQTTPLAIL
jgi:hypothetical protein